MFRKAMVVGALALSALAVSSGAASAAQPGVASSAERGVAAAAPGVVWRGQYATYADCEYVGERGVQYGYWDSYECWYNAQQGHFRLWTNR